jgi:hypothetical protein
MERPNKGDSTVTQLWNSTILSNPEDGDDTFTETSVGTRATWYKVPEGIYNWYCHESILEDYETMEYSLGFFYLSMMMKWNQVH